MNQKPKSYSEQMEEQLEPRPFDTGDGVSVGRLEIYEGSLVVRSLFFPEPTAHETWVRNRISRGAHYDPADDGPETDKDFMAWVRIVVLDVLYAQLSDLWLSVPPKLWDDGPIDAFDHGRE